MSVAIVKLLSSVFLTFVRCRCPDHPHRRRRSDLSPSNPSCPAEFEKTNPFASVRNWRQRHPLPADRKWRPLRRLPLGQRPVRRPIGFESVNCDPTPSAPMPSAGSRFSGETVKAHPVSDLTQNWVRFVALPNPQLAPYGAAAQQALEHAGLWIRSARSGLRRKRPPGPAAFRKRKCRRRPHRRSRFSKAANRDLIPADWHAPIVQKAGIVAGTARTSRSRASVLAFLTSPAGQAIFAKFGFGCRLSLRMRPVVNRLKILERDLRIFLGRRKPGMPQ